MALLQPVDGPRDLHGRRKLEVFNPATLERLGEIEVANEDDVRTAVERARAGQKIWGQMSFQDRGRFLLKAREILLERVDQIVDTICADTGKPRIEAMSGEIVTACDSLTYYARRAKRLLADERKPLHLLKHKKLVLSYRPIGVVGIITPWNFPFILSLNPVAQALMAGNSVVLKPSEVTPFVGLALGEIFEEAGMPEGVFQVLTGDGSTGAALVEAGCDKICFTGSVRTGRAIGESCGRQLIPCTLELGGKDPMIVCADADIERAARGAVWGAFSNSGQVCMSTERVYVVKPVAEDFVNRVVAMTKELRQGPESEGEVDVGALTFPPQLEIIERHVADAVSKGRQRVPLTALAPALDGNLWLGDEDGELMKLDIVTLQRQREAIQIPSPQSPGRPEGITGIHQRANGDLWLATRGVVCMRVSDSKHCQVAYQSNGAFAPSKIVETKDGALWFLEVEGSLSEKSIISALRHDLASGTQTFFNGDDLYRVLAPSIDAAPPPPTVKVEGRSKDPPPGQLMAVDPQGRLWFADDAGLIGFRWLASGNPTRPVLLPFLDRQPTPGAIERSEDAALPTLWRGRPRAMLRSRPDGTTEVVSHPTAWPITRVEAAPDGAMWFGYGPGGLTLRRADGTLRRYPELGFAQLQGGVLDISQIPGADAPRAWIATQDGVMLVSAAGVERRLRGDAVRTPGPVDHLVALEDGSAWLAFNVFDPTLYLDPTQAGPRASAHLRHLPANAGLSGAPLAGPAIELERGTIMDLAVSPGGKLPFVDRFFGRRTAALWVGTSAGLYRLEAPVEGQVPQWARVTASGTLPALPTRHVTVDAEGTVWLGIDALGDESGAPATLLGYRPGTDTTQGFDTARGLPEAERIEFLETTADGDLVVLAANQLLIGRGILVPGVPVWLRFTMLVTALILGGAAAAGAQWYVRRRELARRYAPLATTTTGFFEAAGAEVTRHGVREFKVVNAGKTTAVRCALGELLPVEEVQDAFRVRCDAGDAGDAESYLVYPRELDPAAARQFDVYRLREETVIIPLPAPFLRAKRDEGEDAAREALDGIHRRYLGDQDLFDVRNAIDEPRFFFGRRTLLDDLFHALTRGEHVALVGPRKSGKTSALNLLQQRLSSFPVVKIDLQLYDRNDDRWPRELLAEILERYDRWGQAHHGDAWRPPAVSAYLTGSSFRHAMLERRELQPRRLPLVLLVDEIERIFPPHEAAAREHVERFNAAAGVLRSLGQEGGERLLSIIVADLHLEFSRTNEFSVEGTDTNPFYRFFQERFLPALEAIECDEMLSEIGHAMGLILDPEVCEAVFADSGGHASLARQLASAACRHRGGAEEITPEHYRAGLDWLANESGLVDGFFRENFWQPANAAEKRVLALVRGEEPVTEESLEAHGPLPAIDSAGLRQESMPSRDAPREVRRRLLATSLVERVDGGYRARGALFRAWLRDYLD